MASTINGCTAKVDVCYPKDGWGKFAFSEEIVLASGLETEAFQEFPDGRSQFSAIQSKLVLPPQCLDLDNTLLARLEAASQKGKPWSIRFTLPSGDLSWTEQEHETTGPEDDRSLRLHVKPSAGLGFVDGAPLKHIKLQHRGYNYHEESDEEGTKDFCDITYSPGISAPLQQSLFTDEGNMVKIWSPKYVELEVTSAVPMELV